MISSAAPLLDGKELSYCNFDARAAGTTASPEGLLNDLLTSLVQSQVVHSTSLITGTGREMRESTLRQNV